MTASVRRPPRGEYAKTAQRRLEIIGAAAATFSESGFRDGSLRDVAQRVGITHAGIRHHFPTKVDLLMAVLEWRDEEALGRARANHPVGVGVLRAWIDSTRRNANTPMLVDLELTLTAEATSPDHPAYLYFRDRYARANEILVRAFKAIAKEGQLAKSLSPESAARLFLSATLGLQTLWLKDRSVDVSGELTRQARLLLSVAFE
jgi:AcrR family transcriptional regulator